MPAHFYHLFSLLLYKAKVLVSHQLDKHLLMHLPPEYWIEWGRVSYVDYATPKFLLYSICKIGTNFRFFFENHGKATETKSMSQSILMMNHLHGLKDVFKVHIFWEGRKILRNLHLTFDWHYIDRTKVRLRFHKILLPS